MHQVLTEEQSNAHNIQLDKEISEWWVNLPLDIRKKIYNYHVKIIEHIDCSHEYVITKFYSEKIEQCKKCSYTRKLVDSRDNKLNRVI